MGSSTQKKHKTKRRTRDLDQIIMDIKSQSHLKLYQTLKVADDLPGLGKYYCIQCAKYFEGERNLMHHRQGKSHKRRLKMVKEPPYTQKEADRGAGLSGAGAHESEDS